MSTDTSQISAKIIPFPVDRIRKSAVAAREETKAVGQSNLTFGGAWYHDAAMQDSKRAGER